MHTMQRETTAIQTDTCVGCMAIKDFHPHIFQGNSVVEMKVFSIKARCLKDDNSVATAKLFQNCHLSLWIIVGMQLVYNVYKAKPNSISVMCAQSTNFDWQLSSSSPFVAARIIRHIRSAILLMLLFAYASYACSLLLINSTSGSVF